MICSQSKLCLLMLSVILIGCAHPVAMVGPAGKSVDASKVVIYYPGCTALPSWPILSHALYLWPVFLYY